MSYKDPFDQTWFPTRSGSPTGAANERQMLDVVGPNEIRTRISKNNDGSDTLLRTRGGMPHFSTIKSGKPASDLLTPHSLVVHMNGALSPKFYTKDSFGAWRINSAVSVPQRDVLAYWCGSTGESSRPVVVALSAEKRFDLSATGLPSGVASTAKLLGFFDGVGYLYTTQSRLYGPDDAVFYEISAPEIPTIETTEKNTPPFVVESGEAVALLAYRFGEISLSGTYLVNFRSIMATPRTLSIDAVLDVQLLAPRPVPLVASSNTSGAGAKEEDRAEASYVVYGIVGPSETGYGLQSTAPGEVLTFQWLIGQWVPTNYANPQNQSGGFHDVYSATKALQDTTAIDLLPVRIETDISQSFALSAQRAQSRALLDDYLSIVAVGRGEGLWDDDSFLKDINYTAINDSKITFVAGSGVDEMHLEVFSSVGSGVGSGKKNTYIKKTCSTIPRTQPWEGMHYYQTGGGPVPGSAEFGYYRKQYYDDNYPPVCEVFPPQYPDQIQATTTYDNQTYAGSAAQLSSSVFIIDCDTRLNFAVGIECEVSVAAGFSADGNGKWSTGPVLNTITHDVRVSLVWWHLGVKRTKDVYVGQVTKRAGLYARLIYAYMADILDDPDGTYTLEPLEINPPFALYESLANIRNNQGVSPHYAGFSATDAAMGVKSGLEYSSGPIRQRRAMDGMVYYRVVKLSDFSGCDWLFDATGISAPISNNPLETDPRLTRKYGFSDELYDLFTNGAPVLELRDWEEYRWTDEFYQHGTVPPTCYRV